MLVVRDIRHFFAALKIKQTPDVLADLIEIQIAYNNYAYTGFCDQNFSKSIKFAKPVSLSSPNKSKSMRVSIGENCIWFSSILIHINIYIQR